MSENLVTVVLIAMVFAFGYLTEYVIFAWKRKGPRK